VSQSRLRIDRFNRMLRVRAFARISGSWRRVARDKPIAITFGISHYRERKKYGRAAPTKAVAGEKPTTGGGRLHGRPCKSRARHPCSGQLRRETDLPSRGSLSRNCAYRVRARARARNWISRRENTSPRGGAGYPGGRENGFTW